MKRIFVCLFVLCLSMALMGQWDKQGVTSGTVQAIETSGSTFYIAVERAGIFQTLFADNIDEWEYISGGLEDMKFRDMFYDHGSGDLFVLTEMGIYYWAGTVWEFLDPAGLEDGLGFHFGYPCTTSIASYYDGVDTLTLFLGTDGFGMYKRSRTGMTWDSQWSLDLTYSDLIVTSLDADGFDVIAGSAYATGNGTVQAWNSVSQIWSSMTVTPSCDPCQLSILDVNLNETGGVLAGTSDLGILHATGVSGNLDYLCSESAPPLPIKKIDGRNGYYLASGGPEQLYEVGDPDNCPIEPDPVYKPFRYFRGPVTALLADDRGAKRSVREPRDVLGNLGLVGSFGTGLLDCDNVLNPCVPHGTEGIQTTNYIQSKNIKQIAAASNAVFAASGSDGLYKARITGPELPVFVRYFYSRETCGVVQGTSVVIVPGYDDNASTNPYYIDGLFDVPSLKTVYLGTEKNGIYRSDDGGATWNQILGSPIFNNGDFQRIVKLIISPGFWTHMPEPAAGDRSLFALTGDGRLYSSNDYGETWLEYHDFGADVTTEQVYIYDIATSADYFYNQSSTDGYMFVATSIGLLRKLQSGIWTKVFPDPSTPPYLENIPVLNVEASPGFTMTGGGSEEQSVILGTSGFGLWSSVDLGNFGTFVQLPPPYNVGDVVTLTNHPITDTTPLLTYFTIRYPQGGGTDGLYTMTYNAGGGDWTIQLADNSGLLPDDARYTEVAFEDGFDNSTEKTVYVGHANQKIWLADHDAYGGQNWLEAKGFFNTPPGITDVAVKPELNSSDRKFVAAATDGYGVMVSFDGGQGFFPFGAVLRPDNTVTNTITSIELTHTDRSLPTPENWTARIMAGTPAGGVYTLDLNMRTLEDGTSGLIDCQTLNSWLPSTLGAAEVYDLEYRTLYCDMWASTDSGVYLSSPGPGATLGLIGTEWILDTAQGLTGINERGICDGSRGVSSFTWGAQPGQPPMKKRAGFRTGEGAAWLKIGDGSWSEQSTSGLSVDDRNCDFQAIKQAEDDATWNGVVFMGCQDNYEIPAWVRVYRGEGCPTESTPSGTCHWRPSDVGLAGTSGRVEAFALTANGILVGLDTDPPESNNGGVFFSDTHSLGYAWVEVEGYPLDCESSTTLAATDTTVYSGTSCDGVYASDTITVDAAPVAAYSWSRTPWNETAISFEDRSAAIPTSCDWDLDNDATWEYSGISCDTPVTYDFETTGTHTLGTLNSSNINGSSSDYSYGDVEIYYTNLVDISYNIGTGEVTITWDRLTGDTGFVYNLYEDSDADGGTLSLVESVEASTCGFTTCQSSPFIPAGSEAAFFRIQAIP